MDTHAGVTTDATDEEAIRAMHAAANAALSRGDLDGVMEVYAADVISMPANQPPLIGRNAVRAMWQGVLEEYTVASSITVEEVVITGPWAYERGVYRLTLTSRRDGSVVEDDGKYLDIVRREPDGRWKYARVSWSSNRPAH